MRKQQELMREIELRRKMKATVVPTNDQEVRRMLRQLQEPITQFGEREVRAVRRGWPAGAWQTFFA
jgi:U4/U6 small nuclear ribonucleoprotein PRP4